MKDGLELQEGTYDLTAQEVEEFHAFLKRMDKAQGLRAAAREFPPDPGGPGGWTPTNSINVSYGVRGGLPYEHALKFPPDGTRTAALVPYRWSGLSASPDDRPGSEARLPILEIFAVVTKFLGFLQILVQGVIDTFAKLQKYLIGEEDNDPNHLTRAYQPEQVLEPKKNEIELQQFCRMPKDALPRKEVRDFRDLSRLTSEQTGMGIWAIGRSGKVRQLLYTPKMFDNVQKFDVPDVGWAVPNDVYKIRFQWLARNQNSRDNNNGGECFGRVAVYVKNS